jgi:hypothetical protein
MFAEIQLKVALLEVVVVGVGVGVLVGVGVGVAVRVGVAVVVGVAVAVVIGVGLALGADATVCPSGAPLVIQVEMAVSSSVERLGPPWGMEPDIVAV